MIQVSRKRKTAHDLIVNHIGEYCNMCGNSTALLHLDHVVPLCMAGGDSIKNLQVLCWRCHAEKTRKDRQIAVIAKKLGYRYSCGKQWIFIKPRAEIVEFYNGCYNKNIFTIKDYDIFY